MRIGRAERMRMERAHVQAWPALRTRSVDEWLWRCSGGGSQRANSVSTVEFNGADVGESLDTVEALFRAYGSPARFQTYDDTQPPGLEQTLRERGYQSAEPTTTMFRPVVSCAAPDSVVRQDFPWPGWLDVYLDSVTPDRREVNRAILDAIPRRRAFLGCRHDGHVVAAALCAISFGCAVVECVATRPAFRRQGFSRAVLAAALGWAAEQDADLAGLQVAAGNRAAIRLYESLGFVAGASNRFWILPTGFSADGNAQMP